MRGGGRTGSWRREGATEPSGRSRTSHPVESTAVRLADRRPALLAGSLGTLLFGLMCLVPRGGLLSDEQFVDVHLYRDFSERMLHGLLPYADFFVEYPPGSIPAFIVPGWIAQDHYQGAFRIEMLIIGAAAVAIAIWALARAGASPRRLAAAAVAMGLLPLALGPVLLNGYDLWPTLLAVGGLALLIAGRDTLACGFLGLATIAKVFPVVLLPLALLWAWRRGGREAVVRGATAFVVAVVAVSAYWAVIAPGGLGYSFEQQAKRGLQNESLGASFLYVLDKLGLYHARLRSARPARSTSSAPSARSSGRRRRWSRSRRSRSSCSPQLARPVPPRRCCSPRPRRSAASSPSARSSRRSTSSGCCRSSRSQPAPPGRWRRCCSPAPPA